MIKWGSCIEQGHKDTEKLTVRRVNYLNNSKVYAKWKSLFLSYESDDWNVQVPFLLFLVKLSCRKHPFDMTPLVVVNKRRSSECFSLSKIISTNTNTIYLKITGESFHSVCIRSCPSVTCGNVAVRPSRTGCWLCIETSSRTGKSQWAGRMLFQRKFQRWFPDWPPSHWSSVRSSPCCTLHPSPCWGLSGRPLDSWCCPYSSLLGFPSLESKV